MVPDIENRFNGQLKITFRGSVNDVVAPEFLRAVSLNPFQCLDIPPEFFESRRNEFRFNQNRCPP